MGIRKIPVCILIAVVATFSIFSMTIDDMVAKAMENSSTIRTLELNRENSLITKQINDADDSISVTVKSGDVTVRKEGSPRAPNAAFVSFSPSVDVQLPEFNNTNVGFGVSNSTSIRKNGDATTTVTPYASYKHTVDMDSFTDTRDDITKRTNELKLEQNYKKSKLQFENSVLQSISSILQSQSSIKSQQLTYDRLVLDYENGLSNGDITKDSVKDLQTKMNIDSKRVSLENAKDKLSKALESFKKNYGYDFEVPESIRTANLDFTESAYGNTTVLLAELALETARQAVSVAEGTSNKFQLGADASMPMTFYNTNKDPSVAAEASVSGTITGSNYSVGAKAGGYYTISDSEFYPYVTISGTWKNKTTTQTDELNLQSLRNKVLLAQIDYDNALQTYRNDSASLRSDIEDYENTLSQFEVSATYNALIFASTQKMHDSGLATDRELEDAKMKVDSDKIQRMIYMINALVLENNIAINEL